MCVCVCGTSYGEHIFILNEPLNTSQEVVFSFWTFELEFNRVSRQRLVLCLQISVGAKLSHKEMSQELVGLRFRAEQTLVPSIREAFFN